MAKRSATTQLTKDNCEDDDPIEEAGHFAVASREELARRPIKTARRKLVEPGATGNLPTLFSGFKGFTSTPTSTLKSTTTTFTSFSSALTANFQPTIAAIDSFALLAPTVAETTKVTAAKPPSPPDGFLRQLKLLNKSVLLWADQHVRENPYIDLQPVFSDYAAHFKQLEERREDVQLQTNVSFVERTTIPTSELPVPPVTITNETAATEVQSVRDENQTTKSDPRELAKLSVAGGSGFLGQTVEGEDTTEKERVDTYYYYNADEPYIPPKPEAVEMEEPGCVYSIRCKLFFQCKDDGSYKEKGVGMLYLKPAADTGKVQLLVRAGTATGNILLNVLLHETLPTSRLGKNNVTIVCVPNPPLDPKKPSEPTTMLIRVKTPQDADSLLENLNHFKTSCDLH